MKNKTYITTTLPYVNADPHIGFALEIIEADVLARFYRAEGREVFFNTGTDEHGAKIFEKAQERNMTPQELCDENVVKFQDLKEALNLTFNSFIRTTDEKHKKAAQEFWLKSKEKGDIYKKKYEAKYCVGCELQKTNSELENGRCPLHPNREIEIIEEENYFFRFSKYQKKLLELYKNYPDFVLPEKRFNEIKAFIKRGPEDFSISRLKSKMPWGVPVPDDSEHVMYVWFDALVNYIDAIGWPNDMKSFNEWWPVVQVCGKDNLRQQSAMWQAMLMSADLPASKQIFINGFIVSGGKKMSKSLGNVISPFEMKDKFGIDGTRYLLLSFGKFGEDIDITWEKMIEKYNADLANGLGNLTSRVIKLEEETEISFDNKNSENKKKEFARLVKKLELGQALEYIWKIIDEDNKFIGDNKPWELKEKDPKKFNEVMNKLLIDLNLISELLISFMPETAEKIKKALKEKKISEVLFQRIK